LIYILFLSHATRDKRDFALAHKLADALQAQGVRVWIAPDSIPPGERWQKYIVSGVMDQCTHFLVILSAESIQADWVLEEIRLAVERQKRDPAFKILPPPVSKRLPDFPGKDVLDSLQWVEFHSDFWTQLQAVSDALGLRPDARPTLTPGKVDDFVGREYVFREIDDFIKMHDRGYFIIEGDPGAGKSALLAEFVQRNNHIAHFNIRGQGINRASHFLGSVCKQLIARFGLSYSSLPPDALNDGGFPANLLKEASQQIDVDSPLVTTVDALNEVDLTGHPDGANILFLPTQLPEHAYVVLTRREVDLPFTTHAPINLYDVNAHQSETIQDIREYLRLAAERDDIRSWLNASQTLEAAFIDHLADKSKGNFMYLRYVLPEIEQGRYDLETLPVGLERYYEDHWRRMGMTARPLPRAKIRIVYILCELRQPASRTLIHQFADDEEISVDKLTVQDVLDEWDQFLHKQCEAAGTRYSIYHNSFRDFLHRKDIVEATGESIKGINAVIADDMWTDLFDE
jgi:hypothetical protein